MVASEVYSSEVKKTEVLMEHFRRAIGVPPPCPYFAPSSFSSTRCLTSYPFRLHVRLLLCFIK